MSDPSLRIPTKAAQNPRATPRAASDSLPVAERLAPGKRPPGSAAGYHRWHDLIFLHWSLPVAAIRPLVPQPLTIDTWNGEAWVGIVAFGLAGVRPRWFPALPWTGSFLEVNVRTYVHLDGSRPGVWFFSLDANSWPIVEVVRRKWHLNYRWATMTAQRGAGQWSFESARRRAPEDGCRLRVTEERPVANLATSPARFMAPSIGTLEHFLLERYLLYTQRDSGELLWGQVHHPPYTFCPVQVAECKQTLLAANRMSVAGPPVHAVYSPGVDVEVFGLRPVR